MKKFLVGLLIAAMMLIPVGSTVLADVGDRAAYRQWTVETYAESVDEEGTHEYAWMFYGSMTGIDQIKIMYMREGILMYWSRQADGSFVGFFQRGMFTHYAGTADFEKLTEWFPGLADLSQEQRDLASYIVFSAYYWYTDSMFSFWNPNYADILGMKFQEQRPHVTGCAIGFEEEKPEVLKGWLQDMANKDYKEEHRP